MPHLSEYTYSVFVGHINKDVRKGELRDLFQVCGEIVDVVILEMVNSGSPYNYGFVRFIESSAAYRAVNELNRWKLKGVELVVDLSKDTVTKLTAEKRSGQSIDPSLAKMAVSRVREVKQPLRHSRQDNRPQSLVKDTMYLYRVKEVCTSLNLQQDNGQVNTGSLLERIDKSEPNRCPSLWGNLNDPSVEFQHISHRIMKRCQNMGPDLKEFGEQKSKEFLSALDTIMKEINNVVSKDTLEQFENVENDGLRLEDRLADQDINQMNTESDEDLQTADIINNDSEKDLPSDINEELNSEAETVDTGITINEQQIEQYLTGDFDQELNSESETVETSVSINQTGVEHLTEQTLMSKQLPAPMLMSKRLTEQSFMSKHSSMPDLEEIEQDIANFGDFDESFTDNLESDSEIKEITMDEEEIKSLTDMCRNKKTDLMFDLEYEDDEYDNFVDDIVASGPDYEPGQGITISAEEIKYLMEKSNNSTSNNAFCSEDDNDFNGEVLTSGPITEPAQVSSVTLDEDEIKKLINKSEISETVNGLETNDNFQESETDFHHAIHSENKHLDYAQTMAKYGYRRVESETDETNISVSKYSMSTNDHDEDYLDPAIIDYHVQKSIREANEKAEQEHERETSTEKNVLDELFSKLDSETTAQRAVNSDKTVLDKLFSKMASYETEQGDGFLARSSSRDSSLSEGSSNGNIEDSGVESDCFGVMTASPDMNQRRAEVPDRQTGVSRRRFVDPVIRKPSSPDGSKENTTFNLVQYVQQNVGRGRGITQTSQPTQKPGDSVGRGILRMHNSGDSSNSQKSRGSGRQNTRDSAAHKQYGSGRSEVARDSAAPQQNISSGQITLASMGVGRGKLS